MIVFTISTVFASAYTKAAVSFAAGSAVVRAWFSKEIKAGRAYIAEVEAKVKVAGNKIETSVKTDANKVITDIKKI